MSFLSHLGNAFKKILGIATTVAQIAEPFVVTAFPELKVIYTTAIGLAVGAETMNLTGTGPDKLAQLVANLEPQILKWASDNGIVWDKAGIEKWTSALVDTINLIPAPSKPPVAPATNV